jgi:5-methylthioadenosine/S-adenosylhomocysteine deaminase
MAKVPIDPLDGPQYALKGRIVTMNDHRDIIEDGIVYVDKGKIISAQKSSAPAPAGFAGITVIDTKGTIYPGLIELHNHLSYNVLRLWQVPKKYTNRNQWGGTDEYRKLISGPMTVLGRTPGFVEAVVRYVECKCLMGGVTTSQGIALFSNNGIQKYYRGTVRNVENTDDSALPEALSKISDVEAASADAFFQRLKKETCLLLHLSEGTDAAARKHFEDLKLKNGNWAVNDALAGIHCVALEKNDLKLMKSKGASMIWSPLSNLLLYGATADIVSAVKLNMLIGIGSDWSPSGSKNLFGELKVARIVSRNAGVFNDDADILALATINAARILKWDKELGSIENGKRADFIILEGTDGDPYKRFLSRSETAISLVIINGFPRYGHKSLMNHWTETKEHINVGGVPYDLYLKQATADPVVGVLSLTEARNKLQDGLKKLPTLAKQLEKTPPPALNILAAQSHPQWYLLLDHNDEVTGEQFRFTGALAGSVAKASTKPLSEIVEKMELDQMTVADDQKFLNNIKAEKNLPKFVGDELATMYQP